MAASSSVRPCLGRLLGPAARMSSSPLGATTTTPTAAAVISPRSFSTSPALSKRKSTRDNSRLRGVSSLRRSGPREPLSVTPTTSPKPEVSGSILPRPRAREQYQAAVEAETDPNHGLWGFFYPDRRRVPTPTEDSAHGRAWTVEELRAKSWDDLHRLWWVCARERNRISTASYERQKANLGFGDQEASARDDEVRLTMRAIKHALTERYYVWEDARVLAARDPEVDLSGKGTAYTPGEYLEAEETEALSEGSPAEGEAERRTQSAVDQAAEVDPSTIAAKEEPANQSPRT